MNFDDSKRELLLQFMEGRLGRSGSEEVEALLLTSEEARSFVRDVAEQAVLVTDIERMTRDAEDLMPRVHASWHSAASRNHFGLRWTMALSGVFLVILTAGLIYLIPERKQEGDGFSKEVKNKDSEERVAYISGISGPLFWRGDRGQVVQDLSAGRSLTGGTIEGIAPDSWLEISFRDGSKVMIAGVSMLTFSDNGQKTLHLSHGVLSASVAPQPDGKPMLIHTRTADLHVLGTRFDVEAELDSTALQVNEGRVQIRRRSDGRTVDVLAHQRVLTGVDGPMFPVSSPAAVNDWRSQLQLGPENTYGKWVPASSEGPAVLKAIPFLAPQDQSIILHLLGLPVRRMDSAPVVVIPGSHFVVRGRMATSADAYLGIRVIRSNGEFAGMFLARGSVPVQSSDGSFDVRYDLSQFGLDPCVWDRKDELPAKPDGLVMTCVWCFTHTGEPTGLEVMEIELIPPTQD